LAKKENKIRMDVLGVSSTPNQFGSYTLVLGERHGDRRLAIIIGGFEAQAIMLEFQNIKPSRPLTHDLIFSIARSFDIQLKEVVISDLREGVFFSYLSMYQDDTYREIDARPSDAVAIAVRYRAPIYTYEEILQEAGIFLSKENDPAEQSGKLYQENEEETDVGADSSVTNSKLARLQAEMKEAIANEDYERAARLRDQIQKLGGKIQ
jgi:bifunctional DNase/RNase